MTTLQEIEDDEPAVVDKRTIEDEAGHTTQIVLKADGSISIWQWATGYEKTVKDDLIIMSRELSEEVSGILVRMVYGSLFLNPV